jgi:hypothetical protein
MRGAGSAPSGLTTTMGGAGEPAPELPLRSDTFDTEDEGAFEDEP